MFSPKGEWARLPPATTQIGRLWMSGMRRSRASSVECVPQKARLAGLWMILDVLCWQELPVVRSPLPLFR